MSIICPYCKTKLKVLLHCFTDWMFIKCYQCDKVCQYETAKDKVWEIKALETVAVPEEVQ